MSTIDCEKNIRESIDEIRELPETWGLHHTCLLRLAEDGQLNYRTNPLSDHGFVAFGDYEANLYIQLQDGAVPASLAEFLKDNIELVNSVVEGMSTDWGGNNPRAVLTEEAAEAFEHLTELVKEQLKDNVIEDFPAEDWLCDIRHKIAAAETVEEAEAIAAEAVDDGEVMDDPNGYGRLVISLNEALRYARDVWHDKHGHD